MSGHGVDASGRDKYGRLRGAKGKRKGASASRHHRRTADNHNARPAAARRKGHAVTVEGTGRHSGGSGNGSGSGSGSPLAASAGPGKRRRVEAADGGASFAGSDGGGGRVGDGVLGVGEAASVADAAVSAAGASYGSHFVSTGGWRDPETRVKNDEWQTCREAWGDIAPILSGWKSKRVWMPFYYDGECAKHVASLGFTHVVHSDHDFFKRAADRKFLSKVDLILDNPPYTGPGMKERLLRALVGTGKPFVMLLPSSVLASAALREILQVAHVQVLYPRRVLVRKSGKDSVPFKHLVWLCYKVKLAKDIHFVGE